MSGGSKLPPTYSLYQLAGAFGVSVGALLDERAAEPPVVAERLLERPPAARAAAGRGPEELTLFLEGLLASVEMLRGL